MAKAHAIIPARYASTRLPGKPLAEIDGKPMIRHVWERVCEALTRERVFVATDDRRVLETVEAFGGQALLTSARCRSGTDRAAEALGALEARGVEVELVVNVQGDEPFLEPSVVLELVAQVSIEDSGDETAMATLARDLEAGEAEDRSVVKVVTDLGGRALYFSRAPIGAVRDEPTRFVARAHVGLYAYTPDCLRTIAALEPTPLEEAEKLEQLRALEHGLKIAVGHTRWRAMGIDTPEDLKKARAAAY